MRQTADFVRGGGPQLEVLLRVKQAGNPAFAFLEPSDRLYPFYRWGRRPAPAQPAFPRALLLWASARLLAPLAWVPSAAPPLSKLGCFWGHNLSSSLP